MGPVVGLALTLLMSLVPTALFLGLWRGLMYLRDDDLVEQARAMQAQRATYARSRSSGLLANDAFGPSGSDTVVVCAGCGSRNVAGMTYCWHCLAELPDE